MIKFIIGFITACGLWLILLYNVDLPEYRVYDCRISEFHPDFPPEVKEECRKKRNEHLKNEQLRKNSNEITI